MGGVRKDGILQVDDVGAGGATLVDTELSAPIALLDGLGAQTAPAVGAFGMMWDGFVWSRLRGNSIDGVLVYGNVVVSGTVNTELPTGATLTDNIANPTTPSVGALGLVFDGVTWDRQRGDSVDGTLVNLGVNNDVTVAVLPLPTGAATEVTLGTRLSKADFEARINTVGQKVAASSTPVVLASDQTAIPVNAVDLDIRNLLFATDKIDASGSAVSVSNFPATQPVSAVALPLPEGASTEATLATRLTATELRAVPLVVNTKTDLTPSAPTVASVGVASGSAVLAEANRKGLILRNLSNARISLGFGSAAVLDSGVTLYPRDVFEMNEYDFDLGAINAIASAAASNLAVQQYLT